MILNISTLESNLQIKITKKKFYIFIAIFLASGLIFSTIMFYVITKLEKYSSDNEEIISNYLITQRQNETLSYEYFAKRAQLRVISRDAQDLEEIISSQTTSTAAPQLKMTKELSKVQAKLLLSFIPTLWPLEKHISIREQNKLLILKSSPKTNVIATAPGVVIQISRGTCGMIVIVANAFGYSTLYSGILHVKARVGQIIERGFILGQLRGETLAYSVRMDARALDSKLYLGLGLDNISRILKDKLRFSSMLWVLEDISKLQEKIR